MSNRFSTKTAISAHIQLFLRGDSYLCTHLAISAQRYLFLQHLAISVQR